MCDPSCLGTDVSGQPILRGVNPLEAHLASGAREPTMHVTPDSYHYRLMLVADQRLL